MAIEGIAQTEILPISERLRLRRYDGAYEQAVAWYRDPVVYTNSEGITDPEKIPDSAYVRGMYDYLQKAGELYFIEVLEDGAFLPIGDVTLKAHNPCIAIGIARYRGIGVGTQVMQAIIARARELGIPKFYASTVYDFNLVSQHMHESLGFQCVKKQGNEYLYELNLQEGLHTMPNILKWAPKIQPALLRRLYDSSAAGMLDADTLAEAGAALWLRCEAVCMVSRREFYCPNCRRKLHFAPDTKDTDAVSCPECGFSLTLAQYHQSHRHLDLNPGNAAACFSEFYRRYPSLHTQEEQMIAIDTLIHSFHIDAKTQLPNRAAGNNLIEGSLAQVVAFLDEMSGIQAENDARFHETAEIMWKRRRGLL